jgi:hypothetical protein
MLSQARPAVSWKCPASRSGGSSVSTARSIAVMVAGVARPSVSPRLTS